MLLHTVLSAFRSRSHLQASRENVRVRLSAHQGRSPLRIPCLACSVQYRYINDWGNQTALKAFSTTWCRRPPLHRPGHRPHHPAPPSWEPPSPPPPSFKWPCPWPAPPAPWTRPPAAPSLSCAAWACLLPRPPQSCTITANGLTYGHALLVVLHRLSTPWYGAGQQHAAALGTQSRTGLKASSQSRILLRYR